MKREATMVNITITWLLIFCLAVILPASNFNSFSQQFGIYTIFYVLFKKFSNFPFSIRLNLFDICFREYFFSFLIFLEFIFRICYLI